VKEINQIATSIARFKTKMILFEKDKKKRKPIERVKQIILLSFLLPLPPKQLK